MAPATITQVNSSGRHFGHRLAQDQGHLFRFCWVPRETIWIAYGFAHQLSNDCRFMAGRSACPSRNKRTRAQARPCSRLRFHAYSHAGPRQSLSPRLRPTSPLAPPSLPTSMPRSPHYAQANGHACRAPTPWPRPRSRPLRASASSGSRYPSPFPHAFPFPFQPHPPSRARAHQLHQSYLVIWVWGAVSEKAFWPSSQTQFGYPMLFGDLPKPTLGIQFLGNPLLK